MPFGPGGRRLEGLPGGRGKVGAPEAVLGHLEYILAQPVTAEPVMLPGRLGLSCYPK